MKTIRLPHNWIALQTYGKSGKVICTNCGEIRKVVCEEEKKIWNVKYRKDGSVKEIKEKRV